VLQMLEAVDFAEAFAGPRPDLGDALEADDDPFERYASRLDT
jgi:hypothetical protein